MRYYKLVVTDPTSGKSRTWTSHPNGPNAIPDPGALNIEFDLNITTYDQPVGGSTITLWGIAIEDLMQAQNFANMNVTLSGGMGVGLPLANPKQVGVLVQGTINQSFGNWTGTDQTLTFVILPSAYTASNPGNFSGVWQANTPMAPFLTQVFKQAFPTLNPVISISAGIVNSHDETFANTTLESFATSINDQTLGVLNPTYQGVKIYIQGGNIYATDFTTLGNAIPIAFNDLMGQPTWLDRVVMQVQT